MSRMWAGGTPNFDESTGQYRRGLIEPGGKNSMPLKNAVTLAETGSTGSGWDTWLQDVGRDIIGSWIGPEQESDTYSGMTQFASPDAYQRVDLSRDINGQPIQPAQGLNLGGGAPAWLQSTVI